MPGVPPGRTRVRVFGETFVLWPVADQAEAKNRRDMVYRSARNESLSPPAPTEFIVTIRNTTLVPTAASLWGSEAAALGALFGIPTGSRRS